MAADDDAAIVEAQIGRPLRAASTVVARCPLGLPVVVSVPPVLDSGEPFPTRHWLTCPLAHRRIARLEAAGGVREFDRRAREDDDFGRALDAAHARYAEERDALVPASARHKPSGGVAGSRGGVKCLHAHYADWRAHAGAAPTPVGPELAAAIEPLDCTTPCVRVTEGGAERADDWVEPSG
jgi:hypothetical protein